MLELAIDRRPARSAHPLCSPQPQPRPSRREMYAEGGVEPTLEELLKDPLTQALMRRDGVSHSSLCDLISNTRRGLRERLAAAA